MTEPLYITDNDKPPEEIDFTNVDFTVKFSQFQFINWQGKVISLQDQRLPVGVM